MNYKNTNTKGLGKLTPKAALAVIRSIRLKAILLLLLAMPYAGFNLYSQNIIYISPYGYGTGSSWQDATSDLYQVLLNAPYGTQIWVAAGTYKTTNDTDRKKAFILNDGVHLLGGFDGTELHSHQRDPLKNITVLSGEIGSDSKKDNAYTVLMTNNVGTETLIDGFHIINGYAIKEGAPHGDPRCSGGALYNNGANGFSFPTVRNCVFSNNTARDGGAIYNHGRMGVSNIKLQNCLFIDNIAIMDGGVIYNGCQKDTRLQARLIANKIKKPIIISRKYNE